MINRANSVSFWVANMILLQEKAKDRKKVSEKFIQLAEVPCPLFNSFSFSCDDSLTPTTVPAKNKQLQHTDGHHRRPQHGLGKPAQGDQD